MKLNMKLKYYGLQFLLRMKLYLNNTKQYCKRSMWHTSWVESWPPSIFNLAILMISQAVWMNLFPAYLLITLDLD